MSTKQISQERLEKMLEVRTKVTKDLEDTPDAELVENFFAFIQAALATFVDHPIGEKKPSYITAIDYVLEVSNTKATAEQKESFEKHWKNFKESIIEFGRVDIEVIETKNTSILAALNSDISTSKNEEMITAMRRTLPGKCADIWKETEDYEDVLSDRNWDRACQSGRAAGLSPWLFLE